MPFRAIDTDLMSIPLSLPIICNVRSPRLAEIRSVYRFLNLFLSFSHFPGLAVAPTCDDVPHLACFDLDFTRKGVCAIAPTAIDETPSLALRHVEPEQDLSSYAPPSRSFRYSVSLILHVVRLWHSYLHRVHPWAPSSLLCLGTKAVQSPLSNARFAKWIFHPLGPIDSRRNPRSPEYRQRRGTLRICKSIFTTTCVLVSLSSHNTLPSPGINNCT